MGECFFWYWPTRVVPDQRPLNGRCCCVMLLWGIVAELVIIWIIIVQINDKLLSMGVLPHLPLSACEALNGMLFISVQ